MNIFRRTFVLVPALLVLAAVAFLAEHWLERQKQHVRFEALKEKQARFAAAIDLSGTSPESWTVSYRREMESLLGAKIQFYRNTAPDEIAGAGLISFNHNLDRVSPGLRAKVWLTLNSTERAILLDQQLIVAVSVLSVTLLVIVALLLSPNGSRPELATDLDAEIVTSEMNGMSSLAHWSAQQSNELRDERSVREQAETHLALNQLLLRQSHEERTNLGRDLHDGLIQSIYAAGLGLEEARRKIRTDPIAAEAQLGRCRNNLNAAIREARNAISGLAPHVVQQRSFNETVEALVRSLAEGRHVNFKFDIDLHAAEQLTSEQSLQSLHIVQEAVSNALRHGKAQLIMVRLVQDQKQIALLVQDDGAGFNPQKSEPSGNGLINAAARSEKLGGSLQIKSQPGTGTRILLTLPLVLPV
ncbi:MAG TPA: ATP-binding protein [Opitutaceae bacterium]|nr:ATP-binding protein [Opitutaceae bacterium]